MKPSRPTCRRARCLSNRSARCRCRLRWVGLGWVGLRSLIAQTAVTGMVGPIRRRLAAAPHESRRVEEGERLPPPDAYGSRASAPSRRPRRGGVGALRRLKRAQREQRASPSSDPHPRGIPTTPNVEAWWGTFRSTDDAGSQTHVNSRVSLACVDVAVEGYAASLRWLAAVEARLRRR